MATYVPVRRGRGPLHVAARTGRGYRTVCGHTFTGANLSVPQPPRLLGRAGLERFWERVWSLEVVCKRCDRMFDAL